MSEMFEAGEELLEETFPPKPGGLVDRHRKRIADEKAAQAERENIEEVIEERSYRAVKVAVEQPEAIATQTIIIAAGASAQILPGYAYRKRALISVWGYGSTATQVPVALLAKDQGGVVSMPPVDAATTPALTTVGAPGNQFWLANGQILPLESRGQLWAGNPTANPIAVSVFSEFYGPEDGR